MRVELVGRRGDAALMTTPDAKAGYEALIPDGYEHPGRVTARVALRIPFYYPGRAAASLECPALFCVAMKDSVAPSRSTIWHVRKARQGRIKRYRTGHFDLAGAVLSTLGVTAVVYGFVSAAEDGWGELPTIASFAARG